MRITEKRFGKFIAKAETGINRLFLNLNTPQTEKKGRTNRQTDRQLLMFLLQGVQEKLCFFTIHKVANFQEFLKKNTIFNEHPVNPPARDPTVSNN